MDCERGRQPAAKAKRVRAVARKWEFEMLKARKGKWLREGERERIGEKGGWR